MIRFYNWDEEARLKRAAHRYKACAAGTLIVGLAVCVILCLNLNTGNAARTQTAVTVLSVLAGWAAIALWMLGFRPAWAEHTHIEGILKGESEVHEGILTVSQTVFRIPKSVVVKKVILEEKDGTLPLNVTARFASRLPSSPAFVRVETVRRFITAFEILDGSESGAPHA